jgi:diguanylate cyclase (GGDEF)-like protein/putative nucleotidyltransferase with HDIG domain
VENRSSKRSPLPSGTAHLIGLTGAVLVPAALALWATLTSVETAKSGFILLATLCASALGSLLAIVTSLELRRLHSRLREVRELDRARTHSIAALRENLTDLERFRAFQEDVARELQRRNRSGAPLSLLMLHLDGIRPNGERCGDVGAEQLRLAAVSMFASMRGGDAIHRVSSDRFAVILAGESAHGAIRLAERLQEDLRLSAPTDDVTVVAGVADVDEPMTRDTLIRRAELALLEAERSPDRTVIYSERLELDLAERERGVVQQHLKAIATALARAVDAKDSYTRSHSETVSRICELIAAELGLAPERTAKLRLAGLLHDVGKIGIPDTILQKPARLTPQEYDVMKTHTTLGYSILSGAELEEEAEWILRHHERPDGHGYPNGLSGPELPLEPRIILVADAFEAITSDRPYRRRRSEGQAFEELERHTGTHFDPSCVAALRRALVSRGERVEPLAAAPLGI